MNIVFVAPSFGMGGAERVISILSRQLILRGHSVSLGIYNTTFHEPEYPLHPEVRVSHVRSYHLNTPRRMKASFSSLREYFLQEHADVVLSFTNVIAAQCAIVCKKLNIPFVFSERNDPRMLLKGVKTKILQKVLLHYAKNVVFQTEGAKKLYPKRIQKNSVIILNPLDLSKLPTPYCGDRKNEIVSVGRLEPQKRQDVLVKAFAKIAPKYPAYCLKIYGEGTQRKQLEQLIDQLGCQGRIHLMGKSSQVFECIREARLFVLTSDYEGIPNALIEAMALGLPCVSTKCSPGGAEELISHGKNGLLAECEAVDEIAKHMEDLLLSENLCHILGNEAIKIQHLVSAEQITTRWENYLMKVTNHANKAKR